MPCSAVAHRVRIGIFHPKFIVLLEKKSRKRSYGSYCLYSHWDSFTELSFRCVATTVCCLLFLTGIQCVLCLDANGWYISTIHYWMGGNVLISGLQPGCFPLFQSTTASFDNSYGVPFCQDMLLRCGDVEANPGPPKQDTSRQTRLTSQTNRRASTDSYASAVASSVPKELSLQDVMAALTDVKNDINNRLENGNQDINRRLDTVNENLDSLGASVSGLREEVEQLTQDMDKVREENRKLQAENENLAERLEETERKVDELEDRSKRNNLIFTGLKRKTSGKSETWEESENLVKELLKDKLNIQDEMKFERVHRLGKESNSPIIACFSSFKDKQRVLRSKRALMDSTEGKTIFIGEDFSKRVRDVRKKLIPFLRELKADKNRKVTMVYDHLVVDGKKMHFDSVNGKLKEGN